MVNKRCNNSAAFHLFGPKFFCVHLGKKVCPNNFFFSHGLLQKACLVPHSATGADIGFLSRRGGNCFKSYIPRREGRGYQFYSGWEARAIFFWALLSISYLPSNFPFWTYFLANFRHIWYLSDLIYHISLSLWVGWSTSLRGSEWGPANPLNPPLKRILWIAYFDLLLKFQSTYTTF